MRYWEHAAKRDMLVILRMLVDVAEDLIESSRNFARHLEVWHLIFADRNTCGSKREDVGCLTNCVKWEAERVCVAEPLQFDFRLQRWIAHHAIEWNEHREEERQFCDRRDLTLHKYRRACRIDAHREIVANDLNRVALDLRALVQPCCVRVHIRDDEVAVMRVLQRDPALHASNPMPKMQTACRRVASQNAGSGFARGNCSHGVKDRRNAARAACLGGRCEDGEQVEKIESGVQSD